LVSSRRWVVCASADYVFVVGVLGVEATNATFDSLLLERIQALAD
jgi:hypothetical protein